MFIALQIPVIDSRRLHPADATHLSKPTWAGPRNAGFEFMRSMGAIRERKRGGAVGWQAEDIFCSAHRWIRYNPLRSNRLVSGSDLLGSGMPVFRRWMSDGLLMSRLELGWRFRLRSSLRENRSGLERVIRGFFALEVELCFRGKRRYVHLRDLPSHAFSTYSISSSKHRTDPARAPEGTLRHGQALLFVEVREAELELSELDWQEVGLDPEWQIGISIWTKRIEAGGRSVSAYLLHRKGPDGDNDVRLRQIRLNILRMHAEIEAFDELVRWTRVALLSELGPRQIVQLESLFANTLTHLRPDPGDRSNTVGFRIARKAIESGSDGRIDRVIEEVSTVANDLPMHKVAQLMKVLRVPGLQTSFNFAQIMNKTENNSQVHVASSPNAQIVTTQGGAHSTIQVTAKQLSESESFKKAVASLEAALASVMPQIGDPATRQELEVKLRDLKKEGKSSKWYEVSAEGLKEAAETLGAIAAPVVTAATAVLGLLNAGS